MKTIGAFMKGFNHSKILYLVITFVFITFVSCTTEEDGVPKAEIDFWTFPNFTSETGVQGDFEKALKYSKGDIIFLSDQDDVWVENKVEIILNQLKKYDLIVSDAFITDEKLNITNESLFSEINSNRGILKNIIKNTYYGCCITFKRKVLKKALPFPKTREIGHDLWLGIIADRYFKVKFLKEKLIYFRRHENNLTTIKKSKRRLIIKLLGRVKILYYFLKK